MALFSKKKTTQIIEDHTFNEIFTDNRAASDGAIIGGSGDVTVISTDGGAFDVAALALETGRSVSSDAIMANSALTSNVLDNQTSLVDKTLARESLLTSQVLSNLSGLFTGAVNDLNTQVVEGIGQVTNREQNLAGKQSAQKTGLIIAAIIAAALVLPKLVGGSS